MSRLVAAEASPSFLGAGSPLGKIAKTFQSFLDLLFRIRLLQLGELFLQGVSNEFLHRRVPGDIGELPDSFE